jgi:hypothetical protein
MNYLDSTKPEQEANLEYVAVTRAMAELIEVPMPIA